jgi:hypothetical protein
MDRAPFCEWWIGFSEDDARINASRAHISADILAARIAMSSRVRRLPEGTSSGTGRTERVTQVGEVLRLGSG